MSKEEDVEINVTMKPRGFTETKDALRGVGGEADRATTSYRAMSRDTMMLARSMNIINREFLGSNKLIGEMVGVLYGATAVMRLMTIYQNTLNASTAAGNVLLMIKNALSGPIGWGVLAGGGMLLGAGMASAANTHNTSYSTVAVNMRVGSIASNVDADRMIDTMAARIVSSNRSRQNF